jgi:hypothetical protein
VVKVQRRRDDTCWVWLTRYERGLGGFVIPPLEKVAAFVSTEQLPQLTTIVANDIRGV